MSRGISLVLSTFFVVAAVLIALIVMVMSMRPMLENGVNVEAAPTLMVVIPLITVVGIALMRQNHGLHVHFDVQGGAGETLRMLTQLLSVQVIFALFGLAVLARVGYLARFVTGPETSPGSYALVCPGVALSVMTHFWLNKGLVEAGLIDKFLGRLLGHLGHRARPATLHDRSGLDARHQALPRHPDRGGRPGRVTPTPQTRQDTAPPSRRGGFFHVACNSFRHPQGAKH